MTKETRQDIRFYTTLCFGFTIMMIALIAPPLGSIPVSAIYAGGCFLVLAATLIGADVPAIIREARLLKEASLKTIVNEQNNSENA